MTESETREKRRRENVGRERAREREGQRAEQEYIVYSKDKGREGVRERERGGEVQEPEMPELSASLSFLPISEGRKSARE